MGKKEEKITRAAHIKNHTLGTSNEISFSVLDAAKQALDNDNEVIGHTSWFGRIALFTLHGRRKQPGETPTKKQGLPLSNGGFVTSDGKETQAGFDTVDLSSGSGAATSGSSAKEGSSRSSSDASSSPLTPETKSKKAKRSSERIEPLALAGPKYTPEEEIARRKARRRLSKIAAMCVIVVVTIGLVASGGAYFYHDYQGQRSNVVKLDGALTCIKQADEVIFAMDSILKDPFTEEAQRSIPAVLEDKETALQRLDQADVQAREASTELHDSKNKEAANQAVVAVSARRELVDAGYQVMEASQQAQSTVDQVNDVWQQVLQGDDLARSAAKLVVDTTAENVQASKDKTNEALAVFASARTALAQTQASYSEADLLPLATYIEKRVESLGYAIASDDAILLKKKDEASAQNDAYNVADSEAAALAKELPSDPASSVYEAFEQATAALTRSYSTARSQAGTADSFIQDYLGTDDK